MLPHIFCTIGIVAYIFIANYLRQLSDSKEVSSYIRDVVMRDNKNER